MDNKLTVFRIGQIVNTQGLKGEVRVYPYTDDINRFDDLEYFYLDKGLNNKYEVERVRYKGNMVIMKIKGIDSIELAQKLKTKNMYIGRDQGKELEEDEFFVADLIGLDVFTVDGEKVLLVKPQTFMNLSGESVGPLMRYYKIDPSDVYCIYDDMDLPIGKLRIRPNGSSGGHNGIKSLISHIGTENFPRFRVGIGRPLPQWTVIDHVLAPFSEESQEKVQKGIKDTVKAVLGTLEVGIDKGMNQFNPKRRPQR